MEGFSPWPEVFAKKYREEGYWIDKTIMEILEESFERYAKRTALVGDDGREFTYRELANLSTRLALHLNALGLKLYDRVLLQIHNVPEVVITYLAILKAGGIPIMALAAHRDAEIGYFAELSEGISLAIPSAMKDFDFQEMAVRIQNVTPSLKIVLVTGGEPRLGYHSIEELLKDPIEKRMGQAVLPRPNPALPAVLQLSGGTTGIPKLIPRTQNDYVYNFLRNAEICRFKEDTVILVAIPQEHNFALACPGLMGVLSRGGCEVLSGNPTPKNMLELIQRHRVTHWIAVPTMILGVLNHPQRQEYDLSSLEVILTGGSKLNPEIALRIRPELNCDVQQVLGMSEGPLFWVRLDDPEEVKIYTQGRPQSPADEFRIVDSASGKDVPEGEVGELWCRGPYTIRGYYRAPEHNTRAFTKDGYYKTGDLVRLHHSGNVIVEGRIKDTINRGGEKISAEEMEDHILSFPDVDNCAYVAMPDPLFGEKACAYVVLIPGKEMTLESLNGYLLRERKIAKFKLPERLELVDALPLTNVGKVNKKRLREMIAAKLEEKKPSR
ncbi:MAG: AMP-binding protein [Desulfatiglandales bacterium]|nr:AMP-binding protein [Desulfatiglandales bacterium]